MQHELDFEVREDGRVLVSYINEAELQEFMDESDVDIEGDDLFFDISIDAITRNGLTVEDEDGEQVDFSEFEEGDTFTGFMDLVELMRVATVEQINDSFNID